MPMLTMEEVKALDKRTDPAKLFPGTIEFLKDCRLEINKGIERRNEARADGEEPEPLWPWTSEDERRYP